MQPPDRTIKEGLEKINENLSTRAILNEVYKIDQDELKRLSKEFEDFKRRHSKERIKESILNATN